MTKMEGLLFKNVTDGFPACSAWKREMVLIDEPIYSKLFLLWVCCVLFDSLFSCRGDISTSWCDMVQQCRSRQCMSSLGHISILFFFFFLTAELKAVSQLFALPCFSASAEHILWHLIACYLNFKKHGAELCLRRCVWGAALNQGREQRSTVIKQLQSLERNKDISDSLH